MACGKRRPDLDRIREFFLDPETAELGGRQRALVRRVVAECEDGFMLRELEAVSALLEVAEERGGDRELETLFSRVIRLAGAPFIVEKAREEVSEAGARAQAAMLKTLVKLAGSPKKPRLAIEATRTLSKVATRSRELVVEAGAVQAAASALRRSFSKAPIQDDDPVSTERDNARDRDVQDDDDDWDDEAPPPTTARRRTNAADERLGESALELLKTLTTSRSAADAFSACRGPETAVEVLHALPPEWSAWVVELLWNVFEQVPGAAADGTLEALARVLDALVAAGPKKALKELRNEVLILFSLVAADPTTHPKFRESKVLDRLASYAVIGDDEDDDDTQHHAHQDAEHDAGQRRDAAVWRLAAAHRKNFASLSAEDVEMKRLAWALLSELIRSDPTNLDAVLECGFLETLLSYLETDNAPRRATPQPRRKKKNARAHATQLRVLQQQALTVLLNAAPRAPDAFRKADGHRIALKFLDSLERTSEELATDLIRGALRLILAVVAHQGIQADLGDLDGVRVMLKRFSDVDAGPDLRLDAVHILSQLCRDNPENQASFRRLGGVRALKQELDTYCLNRRPWLSSLSSFSWSCSSSKRGSCDDDSSSEARRRASTARSPASATDKVEPLICGVVECLWNAVQGNRRSEACLNNERGLEAVLALLEVGPWACRHQCCGVLADLCRNPKFVPAVKAWKSDHTLQTAVQLLVKAWLQEEARLGYSRPNGAVVDLDAPSRTHPRLSSSSSSPPPSSSSSSSPLAAAAAAPLEEEEQLKTTTRDDSLTKTNPGDDSSDDSSDDDDVDATDDPRASSSSSPPPTPPSARLLSAKTKFFTKAHGGALSWSSSARDAATMDAVQALDLRGKLAGLIEALDPGEDAPELSAEDKACLCAARCWNAFREGEAWTDVKNTLYKSAVKPVAADAALFDARLDTCRQLASTVRTRQLELADESTRALERAEDAYFQSILFQRDQQLRQVAIKKQALIPKSLQIKQHRRGKLLAGNNAQKNKTAIEEQSTVSGLDHTRRGPSVVATDDSSDSD